ncbi:MAG TPA: AEC family transporter [Burkholderiaceae bacterium]
MNNPAIAALIPVVLFIGIGYLIARRGLVGAGAVSDLANVVFLVLSPALLFRTMSTVHVEDLDFHAVAIYFAAAALVFTATLALYRFGRRAAVLGLASTFSNTVMIGVPLVGLAYGSAGLVTLFTLVSVHSLLLLTATTIALELALAREDAQAGHQAAPRRLWRMALGAVRNSIVHPVPLPVIAGLLFAQTGLVLPRALDQSLQMLGAALGPMSLLLVGITLAFNPVGRHLRGALGVALVKNLAMPATVALLGWALGLGGLPLAVMVVTAALPVGANAFLYAQRYRTAEETVTASVAVSTLLGLVSIPLVLLLVSPWAGR